MYILTLTSNRIHTQTKRTLHADLLVMNLFVTICRLHPFAFVWLGSYDTHKCTTNLFTVFVSCTQIVLQGSDFEETSPCPREQQYSGTRWLLLPMDWPWSFLCSYLWQLGEDAGHPDEISVLVQGSRTGCDMLAWLPLLYVSTLYIHIDVAYQWWSWVRLAVERRGLSATCANYRQG